MQQDQWAGQQQEHKETAPPIQDGAVNDSMQQASPAPMMMGAINPQPSVLCQGGLMPGQVIMVQQPSSAAKVIGVLIIISGCFGVIDGLLQIVSALTYSSMAIPLVIAVVTLASSGASVLGGYWMTNYQRRGVQLVLITVLVGFLMASASTLMLGDIMQEELDNGNISQTEYDQTQGFMGALGAAVIAVSAICYGICGLIVAIPMMSATGGLDDSSLFSAPK